MSKRRATYIEVKNTRAWLTALPMAIAHWKAAVYLASIKDK